MLGLAVFESSDFDCANVIATVQSRVASAAPKTTIDLSKLNINSPRENKLESSLATHRILGVHRGCGTFDEFKQVCVDTILQRPRHSVRSTFVDFQNGVLHYL